MTMRAKLAVCVVGALISGGALYAFADGSGKAANGSLSGITVTLHPSSSDTQSAASGSANSGADSNALPGSQATTDVTNVPTVKNPFLHMQVPAPNDDSSSSVFARTVDPSQTNESNDVNRDTPKGKRMKAQGKGHAKKSAHRNDGDHQEQSDHQENDD